MDARYRVRLLAAACAVMVCMDANAQIAPPNPDPLAPKLSTDPRNPPRFQKFTRPELTPLGPPATFASPPSAAGDTGYDATNSKKSKAKAQAKSKSKSLANAPATALGTAPPPAISPYQKSPINSANSVFAAAPGEPPVEIGPIRRKPTKRRAHSEPDDPYAPIGVHAGAFTLFPAVELIGGYDTNPAHTPAGGGASLYTV